MRNWMAAGALALLAGCVGTPPLTGGWGAPSFAVLQTQCGGAEADYGADAQPVYSALYDAWVAKRHGGLTGAQFCAFGRELAARHAALGARDDAAARGAWADYFNGERAKALSWRAAVDPTLRGG